MPVRKFMWAKKQHRFVEGADFRTIPLTSRAIIKKDNQIKKEDTVEAVFSLFV